METNNFKTKLPEQIETILKSDISVDAASSVISTSYHLINDRLQEKTQIALNALDKLSLLRENDPNYQTVYQNYQQKKLEITVISKELDEIAQIVMNYQTKMNVLFVLREKN